MKVMKMVLNQFWEGLSVELSLQGDKDGNSFPEARAAAAAAGLV